MQKQASMAVIPPWRRTRRPLWPTSRPRDGLHHCGRHVANSAQFDRRAHGVKGSV